MNNDQKQFHYFLQNKFAFDQTKVSEHLPVSLLFASIKSVKGVKILTDEICEEDVEIVQRPDIAKKQSHLPFTTHLSLTSRYTIKEWLGNKEKNDIIIQVFYSDNTYELIKIPLVKYVFRTEKKIKREKIKNILACPYCKEKVMFNEDKCSCKQCGNTFNFNRNAFDFLPDDLKNLFNIIETDNVSDHKHPEDVTTLIKENPNKIFLDIGAGFKYHCYENVVNMEIVDYPSTDVLGLAEKLPFTNNSFDFVLSEVVLEHVKDPFECAREMIRVMKPGAELICTVPFLQPLHGYPHHYYNMTRDGLVNLFEELDIIKTEVPENLHPMAAITWILGSYLKGLPTEYQKTFLNLKVEEILYNFSDQRNNDNPIIHQLNEQMRVALACGNRIWAKKNDKITKI